LLFVGSFWVVEALDQWLFMKDGEIGLDKHGIRPREVKGLLGILFAPFLHGDFAHVISNSVPAFVLGWFVALAGTTALVEVTILVALFGGAGTWLIGRSGSVHVGASGVVFGYLGYLLGRGLFERSLGSILVSLVVGVLYGGLVWGVLPTRPGVSWEGHLCGFLAGVLAAWLIVNFSDEKGG